MLLLGHSIILIVGGHYTYAEVPLGDWVREWMGGERNNYDKLGHLAQGFVPAMIARELFLRLGVVNGAGWRAFLKEQGRGRWHPLLLLAPLLRRKVGKPVLD